jgi:hypothetical protein
VKLDNYVGSKGEVVDMELNANFIRIVPLF